MNSDLSEYWDFTHDVFKSLLLDDDDKLALLKNENPEYWSFLSSVVGNIVVCSGPMGYEKKED